MARHRAIAKTPEGRENQLISLAIDMAEKQLEKGTASPSVLLHYLKLGSTNAALEKAKLENETELLKAKRENLKSMQRSEELVNEAIEAMKSYKGASSIEEEYEDDDY